jgi:flavin reductase (DIM6/NTAB) family NADH-FMN oxidoreductase RutF
VVTTRAGDADYVMTVNSLTSVSLNPLLALICIERASRMHSALISAGQWALSVLGAGEEDVARWFATRGRDEDAALAGFRTSPGRSTGLPVFDDAIATLECRTWTTCEGGDHTVVIGEVIGASARDETRPPLLYFDREYRRLADELPYPSAVPLSLRDA